MAWSTTQGFLFFSVVVCAWSMTQNLRGRLASVGLAQAHPNNKDLYHSAWADQRLATVLQIMVYKWLIN